MNERLTEILRELDRHLRALYGDRLLKTVVYGSQARGDARPWSDIDVAVVLQGPVDRFAELHRSGGVVADLSLRYSTVIHCKFVDEESLAKGDRPLVRSILKEGIPV